MATDFERLIISVEANTKQFERAINALPGQVDRAMRGVDAAIRRSQAQQTAAFARFGDSISKKFVESYRKAFLEFFGYKFVKDSVEASAKAGNQSSQEFIGYWATVLERLQIMLGSAITTGWQGAIRVILNDINSVIQQINLGIAALNELSAYTGGMFPKIQQGPIPYFGGMFHVSAEEALKKYKELYDKTAAAPKLDKIPESPYANADKVLRDLIFEEKQLGRTAEEQQVYNNLKKAGIDINDEYGQAIALTTRQLHQEELQLQAVKEVNDGLQESTKTFVQGLIEGQSAAEAFSAAIRKMADALLDLALHSLFNPGGTPLLQNLFGGLLGLGGWTGGRLPGSPQQLSNTPLGGSAMRLGNGGAAAFNTNFNIQGSVDQRTLGMMQGMIQRNNAKQNAELQRQWGNHAARYQSLRGA